MGIGGRLKEARAKHDLTQEALARHTGVGLATIRRIEQTDFEPRLATARKLASVLAIRVEWLVFGTEPLTSTTEEKNWR